MNWLYYLLEANLYLSLFYAGYYLFLSRETFYTLNRIYLLTVCILAFALPFLQLGILKPVQQTAETITQIQFAPALAAATPVPAQPGFTIDEGLFYLYIMGISASVLWFAFKLYKLSQLIKSHAGVNDNGYKMVLLEEQNTAFSFFNYLFIAKNIAQKEMILRHEMVHIRQKHSADIVFTELIKALNWFNPVVYLLQNSLKAAHEYIADEQTAALENDSIGYSAFLVNNAYGVTGTSIAHSFFNYNLLKKRIIMLNQQRSGSLARLKYLLVVPLCAGMVCASTLAFSKTYGFDLLPQTPQAPKKTTAKSQLPPPPPPPVVKELTPAEAKAFKDSVHAGKPQKPMTKQPPKITVVKFPPPPPPANKVNKGKVIPEPTITVVKFPPPAAQKTVASDKKTVVFSAQNASSKPKSIEFIAHENKQFQGLLTYISHNIRYPSKAKQNRVAGGLNISFNLNAAGRITDAKIASDLADGCAEEALKVISSYSGTIKGKPGNYTITVNYILNTNDNEELRGVPAPPVPNSAGGVAIYGYTDIN